MERFDDSLLHVAAFPLVFLLAFYGIWWGRSQMNRSTPTRDGDAIDIAMSS
jgi:hypothetical protein